MRYDEVEWHAAACKGIPFELFYTEDASKAGELYRRMRPMCRDCPIGAECREYAIENEYYGFWGGLTQMERMQMRKRMRHAA